ncbi:winged helix-turn-helix domain-containing protein [Streptomyces sioyaensis]|uniref:helix-turn-helix domain-containing protein n=1 Tax=Streptomyces sioyaensis TaxID=67364 RepID=UPI001F2B951A|nr:helix-turn-helix domain-containing protein [Streptomyces sioyaensis]MCF3172298.1 winged helix-turn-helix domain-containing protein [Streptomyces sioyaensis]
MTSLAEDWLVPWVVKAHSALEGGSLASFLADLATTAPALGRDTAYIISLPVHPAARALGTSPEVLTTALAQLSDAGLLTYSYDGEPDTAHATITLLPAGPSSVVRQ